MDLDPLWLHRQDPLPPTIYLSRHLGMELLVLDQQNRPAEATAPLFYRQLNRQPLFIMAAARVSISIWNSTILLNTPMLLPKLWTFPVLVLSQRSATTGAAGASGGANATDATSDGASVGSGGGSG